MKKLSEQRIPIEFIDSDVLYNARRRMQVSQGDVAKSIGISNVQIRALEGDHIHLKSVSVKTLYDLTDFLFMDWENALTREGIRHLKNVKRGLSNTN